MRKFNAAFILLTFATLFFSPSFGADGVRCGTLQFIENSKSKTRTLLAKPGFENCVPGNYYGEVKEFRTQHFIIYYTQQGEHAVKAQSYIDSLAKYLEQAYKLHKDSLGMNGILGTSRTRHYQKNVPLGLYPVEVIDTGLLRGDEGEYTTAFGLTFPTNASSLRATQIAIENDFLYGADCLGNPSKTSFVSSKNEKYSDQDKWHLALKVTTYHELYHSFQTAQTYITDNNTFWAEASATGAEEIGAPEVNDYVSYIQNVPSRCQGRFMESCDKGYGYSILYLFLFSELGPRFDAAIWKYFSKYPGSNFSVQLARLADSLHMDAEDLFHKFASHLFYSGKRANFSPGSLFWGDMPEWPEWRIKQTVPMVLPAGAFDFIRKTSEEIPITDSVARISSWEYGDSSIWVLSRLLEKEFVPMPPKGELAAYPNPWNPRRHPAVRFKVPENVNKVEIRSSNGALLERIAIDSESSLIWQPKKIPAPGILYYRTLPHGKNKVLIVEY